MSVVINSRVGWASHALGLLLWMCRQRVQVLSSSLLERQGHDLMARVNRHMILPKMLHHSALYSYTLRLQRQGKTASEPTLLHST